MVEVAGVVGLTARSVIYGGGIEFFNGNGSVPSIATVKQSTLSDNTAGNLLLDSLGGPSALTSYVRTLGDNVTRQDRREPALA